jgi:hypothetical protein
MSDTELTLDEALVAMAATTAGRALLRDLYFRSGFDRPFSGGAFDLPSMAYTEGRKEAYLAYRSKLAPEQIQYIEQGEP